MQTTRTLETGPCPVSEYRWAHALVQRTCHRNISLLRGRIDRQISYIYLYCTYIVPISRDLFISLYKCLYTSIYRPIWLSISISMSHTPAHALVQRARHRNVTLIKEGIFIWIYLSTSIYDVYLFTYLPIYLWINPRPDHAFMQRARHRKISLIRGGGGIIQIEKRRITVFTSIHYSFV